MPILWKTRKEIANAIPKISCPQVESNREFVIPPTLTDDFERLLQHDHPNHFTFEVIKDWYDQEEHEYIRASQVPIDWKSKIGNSDMSVNFKVSKNTHIRKGDIVVREDGTIYILNWNIQDHPNNWATQSTECNAYIKFIREVPETTDSRGMLIAEAGVEVIADTIPCIHSEYAGRPDYSAAVGTPGINADHLISVYLQWNSQTKNIRINDEFTLGAYTYRIINVSIAEVQIDGEYGILTLNAKRVAGGGIVE